MDQLQVGSRLGRYEVGEAVGRGGMATVYRATDPALGREVALKVMSPTRTGDPTFVDRFRREAKVVAQLNHPNILPVHDFGEDNGQFFLVTPFVAGGTLEDRLDRNFSIEHALSYIQPVAEALTYSSGQGIIQSRHQPSNVLLTEDNTSMLADFGLARMLQQGNTLTPDDRVMGTPDYIAPEVILGHRPDHRSDVYSLAVLLYRMLLGRTPFSGENPVSVMMAHVNQEAPKPTDLDPSFDRGLEAVVLKALAKDPDQRYGTAHELVQALAEAESNMRPSTGTDYEESIQTTVPVNRTADPRLPT